MHVKNIKLINFGPYEGEQDLELTEGAYSIVARDIDNPNRSNWLGKSTLLESIPYALFGKHRYKRQTDLITTGRTEGGVSLTLSNGKTIKRYVSNSKSALEYCDGPYKLTGKVAQDQILKDIGLSQIDFFASSYVAQRQLARLVLCDPSERFHIVSSWIDLDVLEKCAIAAKQSFMRLDSEVMNLELNINEVFQTCSIRGTSAGVPFSNSISTMLASLEKMVEQACLELDLENAALNESAIIVSKMDNWSDYDYNVKRCNALKEEIYQTRVYFNSLKRPQMVEPGLIDTGVDTVKELEDSRSKAVYRLSLLRSTVQGTFSGVCPAMGLQCPSKGVVDASREQTRDAFQAANEELSTINNLLDEHRGMVSELQFKQSQHDKWLHELEACNDKIRHLESELSRLDKERPEAPPARYQEVIEEHSNIKTRVKRIEDRISALTDLRLVFVEGINKQKALRDKLALKRQQCELNRQAFQVFGKQGAQKILAERALSFIETRANDFLVSAQIPLSLEIKWSNETDALALDCFKCGYAFPSGKSVKVCPVCSSERKHKTNDKLSFELSDRSGAAEDLAGMAFQIAAAQYLRIQRDSNLSILLLDEPFGQLDEYNRRSIASHLSAMLMSSGFQQAMIVAHHDGITDVMPNRIVITSKNKFSTVQVRHG